MLKRSVIKNTFLYVLATVSSIVTINAQATQNEGSWKETIQFLKDNPHYKKHRADDFFEITSDSISIKSMSDLGSKMALMDIKEIDFSTTGEFKEIQIFAICECVRFIKREKVYSSVLKILLRDDITNSFTEKILTQYKNLASLAESKRAEMYLKKNPIEENIVGARGYDGKMINGKREGKWTFYWKDGSVQQEVVYKNNRPTTSFKIFFDEDWEKTRDKSEFEYYRVLNFDESGVWKNNVTDHFKNGDIQMEVSYISEDEARSQNSSKYMDDIPVKWYYKNNQLKRVAHFRDSKLHGKNIKYYENGVVKFGAVYKNGMPYTVMESFTPTGESRDYGTLKEGSGIIYHYSDDGTQYIIDGFKNGSYVSEAGNNDTLGYYIIFYGNKGTDKYNKRASVIQQYYDSSYSKPKSYSVLTKTNQGNILKQSFQLSKGGQVDNFYVYNNEQTPTLTLEKGDIDYWFDNNGNVSKWTGVKYAHIEVQEFYDNGMIKKIKAYTSNPDKYRYTYNFNKNGEINKKSVRNKNLWEVFNFDDNGNTKTRLVYKKNGRLLGKVIYR